MGPMKRISGYSRAEVPNQHYRLTATTQVVETGGRRLEGAVVDKPGDAVATVSGATCTVVQAFEFRTEGPPGAATLSPLGPGPDAVSNLDTLEPSVREILPAAPRPSTATMTWASPSTPTTSIRCTAPTCARSSCASGATTART
jgi:hypothetical protein